jgi:hypothetical protein
MPLLKEIGMTDIDVMKECWLADLSYEEYVVKATQANVYVHSANSFYVITMHWYNQL